MAPHLCVVAHSKATTFAPSLPDAFQHSWLDTLLFSITQVGLIRADLNGGADRLPSLLISDHLRRAIARDNAADYRILDGVDAERLMHVDC